MPTRPVQTSPSSRRFAVAVAEFNRDLTNALLQGCIAGFAEAGVSANKISVVHVPGAFELPLACDRLAADQEFAAIVALGAIVRGDTPHFDFVAKSCSEGLMRVMLDHKIPIIFGALTTDTLAQAKVRCDPNHLRGSADEVASRDEKETPRSNKGYESARAALHMTHLVGEIA